MSDGFAKMGEAESKGTNFIGILKSLRELRGAAVHDATVASLRGPFGDAMRNGQVVHVGWYPVSWYVELQVKMQETAAEGVSLTRSVATLSTQRDLTGLHRALVRMISIETVARNAHRLLQLYWRGGSAEVFEAREDRMQMRLSGWRGFDANVWEDLAASTEATLGIVGAKSPRVRVISTTADQSGAVFEARYG